MTGGADVAVNLRHGGLARSRCARPCGTGGICGQPQLAPGRCAPGLAGPKIRLLLIHRARLTAPPRRSRTPQR